MRRQVFRIAAFAMLAFGAAGVAIGATATGATTIKAVMVHAGNSGVPAGILFRTGQENPDGCTSAWWYSIDKDNPLYDELVAVLLSAQAQGLTVSAYVSGCSGLHPNVTHLYMSVP